ncbi:hypothetical protein BaRGS_00028623 [Batillaria attramentaria]|uniref:Uncharacterized protein n=1 Tax=Batillaria attramentaria TaxID=370345 RepID=A0ABD0JYS0_9CAEN
MRVVIGNVSILEVAVWQSTLAAKLGTMYWNDNLALYSGDGSSVVSRLQCILGMVIGNEYWKWQFGTVLTLRMVAKLGTIVELERLYNYVLERQRGLVDWGLQTRLWQSTSGKALIWQFTLEITIWQ